MTVGLDEFLTISQRRSRKINGNSSFLYFCSMKNIHRCWIPLFRHNWCDVSVIFFFQYLLTKYSSKVEGIQSKYFATSLRYIQLHILLSKTAAKKQESNTRLKYFHLTLAIYCSEVQIDFFKYPFYSYSCCRHSFVELNLLRIKITSLEWYLQKQTSTISKIPK